MKGLFPALTISFLTCTFSLLAVNGADEHPSPLVGAYRLPKNEQDRSVEIVIRNQNDQYTLEFQAGSSDASGAAPEGGGTGSLDSNGVFHFDFEDSFSNKGTGTFSKVPEGYALSIDITTVADSRCMMFYGEDILQKDDSRFAEINRTHAEWTRRKQFVNAQWPAALQEFPAKANSLTVGDFEIHSKTSSDQSGAESGEQIFDISVQNLKSGQSQNFSAPNIGMKILQNFEGWPQFEIWSLAGGSLCERSLYQVYGGKYVKVRKDTYLFEADGKKLIPGDDSTVEFQLSSVAPVD